jgi:hypothetical protein
VFKLCQPESSHGCAGFYNRNLDDAHTFAVGNSTPNPG